MIRTAFVVLLCGVVAAFAQDSSMETVLAKRLALENKNVIVNGKLVPRKGIALSEICDTSETVAARVFRDYGAMWVGKNDVFAAFKQTMAGNSIRFVSNCVFQNETEVALYQANVPTKSATLGGVTIELQAAAMDALAAARSEAAKQGLSITPRGGSTAARRTYGDTEKLWDSRFLPGLAHWVGLGKISRADAEAAKKLAIRPQVGRVLEWEAKGIYFSKDFSKSILYSVAAPGASQHIFMVALDVEQFSNPKVRAILAKHGWFQTVKSDLPHFTFMGVEESELPALGLEAVSVGGQKFWIPKL